MEYKNNMQITVEAAQAVVNFIDVTVSRGAIRGDELGPVNNVRSYFVEKIEEERKNNLVVNTSPAAEAVETE
jgi:hypothetical protein